jgi:hypothetical protein
MRFRIIQEKRKKGKFFYYVQKFLGFWRIGIWRYEMTGRENEIFISYPDLKSAESYIEATMDTQRMVWKKVVKVCEKSLV